MLYDSERKLKIYGYEFDGYWRSAGASISEYYRTNMDFLDKDVRDLFTKQEPYIDTKPKDEPPAKYNMNADVEDSLIGSGTIVNAELSIRCFLEEHYRRQSGN